MPLAYKVVRKKDGKLYPGRMNKEKYLVEFWTLADDGKSRGSSGGSCKVGSIKEVSELYGVNADHLGEKLNGRVRNNTTFRFA